MKICTSDLPGHKKVVPTHSELEDIATEERVDNVRVEPLGFGSFAPRAVLLRRSYWQNGRTIRVKFLDGSTIVQERVKATAQQWEQYINLKLLFVSSSEPADVRISFAEVGTSWSYVGTDCLGIPVGSPTMNYGWFDETTTQDELNRTVLHEFGHAFGLSHEHQSPDGNIPWDKPAVYAAYAAGGWTQADVDHNILYKYTADITNFSAYDRDSIMHYPIDDALTIGTYSVGWNTSLSATDKSYMALQYPKTPITPTDPVTPTSSITPLTLGQRVTANLDTTGEVDVYSFDITTASTYVMTTEGATDTILTLHGPNNQGSILTWNDDSGYLTNARIVKKLQSGKYWLSVRHKYANKTGTYSIGYTKRH